MGASGVLTYYFTRWRGLDPQLAAVVWLLFGLWNAFNDPLFGYISDRTRSKLGRRLPYIRYGAPIYALSFIALWVDWPGSQVDQAAMFFQLFFMLFVFDTLYTAIATSIYVMPYEMAVSNKARGQVMIWKVIFMVVPVAVPLVLIPIIQPGPGEDATMFRTVMSAFAIVIGALIFASTFFYREKHFQQTEQQFSLVQSIKECFKNSSFVVFLTISFTVIYVQTALMQGVLYYFDELKVPAIPLYVAMLIGIVGGLVMWIRQRDYWGVKLSMRLLCLLFGLGCLILLVLGREVIGATLAFLLVGAGFSGAMYLVPLMNGDVIDADEHRTGLRREGMYAGVNSFVTKPAISIAQAVFLNIVTWFGYDQTLAKGTQTMSAQTGILVGWVALPAILFAACFVLLRWYPLAGQAWAKIKLDLTTIHEDKERRFIQDQRK